MRGAAAEAFREKLPAPPPVDADRERKSVMTRTVSRAVALAAAVSACALVAAPSALAQTNNPYPNPIPKGDVLVQVNDVVTLPQSAGEAARMNSAAVSPDGRFFVLDQRGPVYNVTPAGTASQYINLNNFGLSLLNDNGERGGAQVAFHPQFNQPGTPGYGRLYASFSTSNTNPTPDFQVGNLSSHDEVVYEFQTSNPSAATFTQMAGVAPRQVLRLRQPAGNHNGGGLGFNPTAAVGTPDYGALYYSSGDGGGAGDTYNQGQNAATPFSSILRIDPLGTNGVGGDHGVISANVFASDNNANTLAENYAIGFRNPQRFSWDSATGRMLVGDIGQGTIEEVDAVNNGGNYGWAVREGSYNYVNTGAVSTNPAAPNAVFTNPIAEYDHAEGIAVSGGFVYRGSSIPELEGKYVFGDLANGRVFYIDAAQEIGGGQSVVRELRLTEDIGVTQNSLTGIIGNSRADLRFGQDADGNLYLLNKRDGTVRVITAVPEPTSAVALLGGGLLLLGRRRRRA